MNLQELEARRAELENYRKRFRTCAINLTAGATVIGAILGVIYGPHIWAEGGGYLGPGRGAACGAAILFSLFLVFFMITWKITGAKKERVLKEAFKSGIVAGELQSAFQDVDYRPKGSYDKEYVNKLRVFRRFDIARGNDYVRGSHRGRKFSRCDEDLVDEVTYTEKDSDGTTSTRTEYETRFAGTFTALELPNAAFGRLLVVADYMRHTAAIPKQGEAPKQMAIFSGADSGVSSSLDTLKFKREYSVSAQNAAMLTPHRIECLRKLDESIQNRFAVLFEGDKLHLIVEGENCFEVALGKNSLPIAEQQARIALQVKKLTERLDLLLELEKE